MTQVPTKAARQLMALLAKAAGVDYERVRAITCRCEVGKLVEFSIELIEDSERIEQAVNDPD